MSSDGSIVKYQTKDQPITHGKHKLPDNQEQDLKPPSEHMIKRDRIPMEAGITALYMDDKNDEGIVGTTNGDIYYINL